MAKCCSAAAWPALDPVQLAVPAPAGGALLLMAARALVALVAVAVVARRSRQCVVRARVLLAVW